VVPVGALVAAIWARWPTSFSCSSAPFFSRSPCGLLLHRCKNVLGLGFGPALAVEGTGMLVLMAAAGFYSRRSDKRITSALFPDRPNSQSMRLGSDKTLTGLTSIARGSCWR